MEIDPTALMYSWMCVHDSPDHIKALDVDWKVRVAIQQKRYNDEIFADLSTTQINKLIKRYRLSKAATLEIKHKRRQYKNRGYARLARQRRLLECDENTDC
jgi:hypothetical protein